VCEANSEQATDQIIAATKVVVLPSYTQSPLSGEQLRPLVTFEFGRQSSPFQSGVVRTGLEPLSPRKYSEIWHVNGPVRSWVESRLGISCSHDYMCVHTSCSESDNDSLAPRAAAIYGDMLAALSKHGYTQLIRAWNFIPDINRGTGDKERYRQFCLGRASGFGEHDVHVGALPAASAVGVPGPGQLTVVMMACRSEARHIENPRQVEAYRYPRRYGPRSPSFARASLLTNRHNESILLTSGTASIRGHESIHSFDLLPQIDETLENLDAVKQQAQSVHDYRLKASSESALVRVYLRNKQDLERARERLKGRVGRPDQVVYLHADICRRELEIEIETVQRFECCATS